MASPSSPSQANFDNARRRTSTAGSLAQSAKDLVLHSDPPPGFIAATAAATSKAPTPGDIRSGSFGQDGWQASERRRSTRSSGRRQSSGSREGNRLYGEVHAFTEPFAALTEEPTKMSSDVGRTGKREGDLYQSAIPRSETREEQASPILERAPSTSAEQERSDHDGIAGVNKDQRAYTSGYIPPPKLPWTTSTWIGLKAFWKWFLTPFGFLITLYGLNVVAWGGMLFLLLCNASPYMCWAPIPTPQNRKHMSPIAALSLPGPYYKNCNDINSPRRVWLEIDSQILNALFCVTGFGLVPWRFRDLWYLLKYRLTSSKRYGSERKFYGLRVLAGIHRGWFRLPGSETLDILSTREYLSDLSKTNTSDLESAPSSLLSEQDPRLPLPISKTPSDPPTSVRAPPTKIWKMDFFIWCQVWNTFFQCCLCGFMWGMDRYARPPWSTGLFVALACIIAGVGGFVSFLEGKHVKKVEGVAAAGEQGHELKAVKADATPRESVYADQEKARKALVLGL
ncbi:hypothetical protein LTR37_001816 [Vermiconidia calcicola]|uniref:Uncharacterized protein n=1 Tax=Vermiconidia calcicola TaxID=1690605 RepID=A0ACC3NWK6_9PEZI|nr:hypothetical protein LTR37_001816 [Vermiconidia calcicola]